MNKRLLTIATLGLVTLATVHGARALFSLNFQIRADVEPAISISLSELDFGAVTSGTASATPLNIRLSDSFQNASLTESVRYAFYSEPRPLNTQDRAYCLTMSNFPATNAWSTWTASDYSAFMNSEYVSRCGLPLCPFLSFTKSSAGESGEGGAPVSARPLIIGGQDPGFLDVLLEQGAENPDPQATLTALATSTLDHTLGAFHYPFTRRGTFEYQTALGYLTKSNDPSDAWQVAVAPPCFTPDCSQATPRFDTLPPGLDNVRWDCNVWIEVRAVQRAQ